MTKKAKKQGEKLPKGKEKQGYKRKKRRLKRKGKEG